MLHQLSAVVCNYDACYVFDPTTLEELDKVWWWLTLSCYIAFITT